MTECLKIMSCTETEVSRCGWLSGVLLVPGPRGTVGVLWGPEGTTDCPGHCVTISAHPHGLKGLDRQGPPGPKPGQPLSSGAFQYH